MSEFPSNAKRVFKGKIYEVWQWDQKMFDDSTEVFEGLKRPDTVEVIATAGGKILLQEQQQPQSPEVFFSLPGGRADHGETPIKEIQRELLEETGYVSDDWQEWKAVKPHRKNDYTIRYFIARNCRLQQAPQLDAGEKITTKLIAFEELLALSDNPAFRGNEFIVWLLRLRLNPAEQEKFKKLLFK